MLNNNRIAVFVDAENVGNWIKQGGIDLLLEELKTLGQIIIRRAYGVWSRPQLAMHQSALNKQGFELIHCYHPASGKNSADIHMTVDVMECAWQFSNINYFVLVTGDSDFSPVFRRLRAIGKEVIGVGQTSTLSQCVEGTCSRFIYTDEYIQIQPQVSAPPKQNKLKDDDLNVVKDPVKTEQGRVALKAKAVKLIEQVLQNQQQPVNASGLLEKLIRLDKGFSYKALGFKKFGDFIKSIPQLEVTKNNLTILVSLKYKQQLKNPDALALHREYEWLLNKANLLIDPEKLSLVYKFTSFPGKNFPTLALLKEAVLENLKTHGHGISKTDLNRAFYVFIKAGLILMAKTDDGLSSVSVKLLRDGEFLSKVDHLLVLNIIHLAKAKNIELRAKEIKRLTVSPIREEEINSIIKNTA